MRTKILIHLPHKHMRKYFNTKMDEMRYHFGDDVVFSSIWRYWNAKEDSKEANKIVQVKQSQQQELEELV